MSVSTSTGESVIAQGIEDLVTGSVVMGTRPTANYLAGGKVIADPKVTSKLITLVSTEKLEEVIPGIFPPVL